MLLTDKSVQGFSVTAHASAFSFLLFVLKKQLVCYSFFSTQRHICFDVLAVIYGKSPEEIYSNVAPVMVNHFLFCRAQMAGYKMSISQVFFQKT